MQVLIDASNTVLAYGTFTGQPGPGRQIVTIADSNLAALQQYGAKTLANGAVVLTQTAADAAAQAQATNLAAHLGALAQLKPTLVGNATTLQNDIAAIENLIAGVEAGTQPTAAQVLQTLRFILRALAVLHT